MPETAKSAKGGLSSHPHNRLKTQVKLRLQLFSALLIILLVCPLLIAANFDLSPSIIKEAERKYGPPAKRRLLSWQKLITENGDNEDEMDKLQKVNAFFNRITFISDTEHWHKIDYWATPIEFLATNGGDCEDFSLAKYVTLKILGISESKINLTYVKAWKLNQAHMVVTYYSKPDAEPLILDNLINSIKPASQRPDLLPVYSFNGSGLWISKQRGRGKLIGDSDRLSLWTDFLKRMPESLK